KLCRELNIQHWNLASSKTRSFRRLGCTTSGTIGDHDKLVHSTQVDLSTAFSRQWLNRSFWLERLGPDRSHEARDPFHVEIDHRRCVQRQQLRDAETADDRDAERTPQFRSDTRAERQR